IDEFSENCRFTLKTGNSVTLPEVGQLYPGKEGIIYFKQDTTSNLLPDAFGLAPFISPPVIRNSGRKYILPRALKWAAAIAFPIGVAAVIGVTQYDRLSANFASHAGILSSAFSRFSSASLVEKKEAPVIPTLRLVQSEVQLPPAPVAEVPLPAIRLNDRFAVIVGAFRVQENAEKLVTELQQKGIEASVFDQSKTGLFRVTIGTSSNREDASQILASTKSKDISGAWILAK
ncbi:MAG: SPOR domain-containing protein, partial [Bacteroidetes bacterium]|nr:SPOR domain-containing protein [Bacteroidota bacterium]